MERVWTTTRRVLSARNILLFVATVFMTALLVANTHAPAAHALDGPDANWNGDNITFDSHLYSPVTRSNLGKGTDIPTDAKVYVYTETTSQQPLLQKAHIIYFTSGVDPPKATTAQYVVYDYKDSDKTFSHKTDSKTIDITPKGESGSYQSSCSVTGGLGFVICPLTVTLANGMDTIFNLVKGFLEVKPPVVGDTGNDLYIAWNVMRSVANVAFIIVFMIIIYSQITNLGISNYGLKKLLPRLIVAAILVNLSYYITAAAVDISNILGYSVQDILINIRQNTFNITNDSPLNGGAPTWSAVAAAVLSGGALTVGGLIATGGTIAGAIYLLVPILIGALLTIIFVWLVLAARQAIVIILIVLAPLAFVAYLLPNTEQWFKKWRDLFMSMLIFFPAFSLVFGGSQLAGGLIIQNAKDIVGVIFGLAVQIAPLVITPLILRLSSGTLGRIAGMVNNPKRGLIDKTKNWSGKKAEMHRQRGIGTPETKNPFKQTARRLAYSQHRTEQRTEAYKNGFSEYAANRDYNTTTGRNIAIQGQISKEAAEHIHHDFERAMQEARAGEAGRLATISPDNLSIVERVRVRLNGEDSVDERRNSEMSKVAERLVEMDTHSRITETATTIAKNVQITNYAEKVEANRFGEQLRAGGIAGERGAQGALAAAFKAQASAHSEAVSNANSILSHYNYGDDTVATIAKGIRPANVHFDNVSAALQEAAVMKIAGGGNTKMILELMQNLEINPTSDNQDIRQAFADTLLTNSMKPKFAGAGIIANIKQGVVPGTGKARLDNYIVQTINANKLGSAEVLVTQDREYLEAILATLRNNESGLAISRENQEKISKEIYLAKHDARLSTRIGERERALDEIYSLLPAQYQEGEDRDVADE